MPSQVKVVRFSLLLTSICFSIITILAFIESNTTTIGFDGSRGGIFYNTPFQPLASYSPFILTLVGGATIASFVWKGNTVKIWKESGHDYDTFKMITKMRGSPTRIKILNLLGTPKNKLQLAKEMEMDWKAIDSHIKILIKHSFVEEMATIGTSTFYIISEKGKNLLKLISKE